MCHIQVLEKTITHYLKKDLNYDIKPNEFNDFNPVNIGLYFNINIQTEKNKKEKGQHYTSIENIHKVIDPLFLDDLTKEYNNIKQGDNSTIDAFRDKLGSIKYFDPAAGSCNFLIETFMSLRRLEHEAIFKYKNLKEFPFNCCKVTPYQAYGIEVDAEPIRIGNIGLNLAEWLLEREFINKCEIKNINAIVEAPWQEWDKWREIRPLIKYNIFQGNACRMNWEEVISNKECNYIIGNPPFRGYFLLIKEQKEDRDIVFNGWKEKGKLDYVSCWFKKSVDYIKGTRIKCSLVSTSSIIQGISVGILWKRLFEDIQIHFAYKPFKWDLEAQIICIIIGFCNKGIEIEKKYIYDKEGKKEVKNINAYLRDRENVFIESISEPLNNIFKVSYNNLFKALINKPNIPKAHEGFIRDGHDLIIDGNKYKEFIKREPKAKKYIKKLLSADAFLNNKERYCLWLVGVSLAEINSMPLVMERVEKCKNWRLNSPSKNVKKLAKIPHLFKNRTLYDKYMVIPKVSSKNRKYIPMGFIYDKDTVSTGSNLIIKDADLYHFGILESIVHMAWVKTICCGLGKGYNYTASVTYNNFPWPEVNEEQREKIKETAQGILDARAKYPNKSLADLYKQDTMPEDLKEAHEINDKAVLKLYNLPSDANDDIIFDKLLSMYEKLIEEPNKQINKQLCFSLYKEE